MKTTKPKLLITFLIGCCSYLAGYNQNSVLLNLGSANCATPTPGFSLIKNPLTNTPVIIAGCDLAAQLPDYYNVFIAYNPTNNKVYVADIRTGATKIWIMDVGLPGSSQCPLTIPVDPTYTYSYVSNNFEFDNNGDLWSFSNYDPVTGECSIDKFDVNTGEVINSRTLHFPENNFPTAITSGDLTITPNGRMFATLGSFPSRLYEITNYNSNVNASATYLQTMPQNTFGIAYLNGQLEVTGFDANSCYYYEYTIGSNTLSDARNFQNGQAPIDNSSFTPALGATKQIISSSLADASTADIVYEIYVRNMGNTILNNINVSDDLEKAFGVGKIANVHISFTNGANIAGLLLNPLYNGTTVTNMLLPNQQLPNQRLSNTDYYFKIQVACRVSGIDKTKTYYNSAIGNATINNITDPIYVTDSSNNGGADVVDPNNDGNASGVNENIPTPFNITALPVKFIRVQATLSNKQTTILSWKVATPVTDASYFEPQFSSDGFNWIPLTQIPIADSRKADYTSEHLHLPAGSLYYRVKQVDKNGDWVFSSVVLLQRKDDLIRYKIYPNPVHDIISIYVPANSAATTTISLYDVAGRVIKSTGVAAGTIQLNVANLPTGTYLLKLANNNQVTTEKISIRR